MVTMSWTKSQGEAYRSLSRNDVGKTIGLLDLSKSGSASHDLATSGSNYGKKTKKRQQTVDHVQVNPKGHPSPCGLGQDPELKVKQAKGYRKLHHLIPGFLASWDTPGGLIEEEHKHKLSPGSSYLALSGTRPTIYQNNTAWQWHLELSGSGNARHAG